MKKLSLSLFALAASSSAALAGNVDCFTNKTDPACTTTAVPEISALEGTAALALVAAILLLAWERRRAR